MKSKVLVMAALLLGGQLMGVAQAQEKQKVELDNEVTFDVPDLLGNELQGKKKIKAKLEGDEAAGKLKLTVNIGSNDEYYQGHPKLGVYLDEMTFERAYKMHYPYCYGVYVDGVTRGGPADRAGILEGDVIMEFDGVQVRYEDHLVRLIRSQRYGNKVPVKFFRDGEIDSTVVFFAPPEEKVSQKSKTERADRKERRRHYSVGYGGGGYTPIWIAADFSDVNTVLQNLGFLQGIDKNGFLVHGGAGEGYIGKNWFLGGMGAGRSASFSTVDPDSTQLTRRLDFQIGLGGVTLRKRFALTEKIIGSLGLMVGGGGMEITVARYGGALNWNSLDTDIFGGKSNVVLIKRNYLLVQPSLTALIRLNSWLGLRLEAGYLYGYSFRKGWYAQLPDSFSNFNQDKFDIAGSPDTPMEAVTYSVGFWFGF